MRDYQTKTNVGGVPDSNTSTKLGGGESTSLRTENKNAVSRSGQTLAPQDGTGEKTDQLAKALMINGVAGQSMIDGGSAGAYQLTPVTGSAGLVVPDLYDHLSGAIFEFEASNINLGASTLDIGQTAGTLLGVKDLTLAGGVALAGGEMLGRVRVLFDLANDRFELINLVPVSRTAKIQPVDDSVAANALTLTLNETELDFRDSDLTSGTVNNRPIPAPISLVISSGSTLGTVDGVQSRIVKLAIDNGGVIELAAINLAFGSNLDETTLVTTVAEGGAGGADSANVIYSATARANVPYRVVGYVESTQAVAGTWVTPPSTIQGNGGNVNAGMSQPLNKFVSSAQTITAAGGLTLPHGLPDTPYLTSVVLKCLVAEHGYSVGDEVMVNPGAHTNGAFVVGCSVVVDSTNLNIRFAVTAATFMTVTKNTGGTANLTNGSWEAYFRAWS